MGTRELQALSKQYDAVYLHPVRALANPPPSHTSGACVVHGRHSRVLGPVGCHCRYPGMAPCNLAQALAEPVSSGGPGADLDLSPAEHLPLCPAGGRGCAAAGGRGADGSCAQRACPGEVSVAPARPAGGPCEGTVTLTCPRLTPRPPGHHSQRATANGFCMFNNVAIAARHAQQQHRLRRFVSVRLQAEARARLGAGGGAFPSEAWLLARSGGPDPYYPRTVCPRVLIVDWDVHHGQGIQYIFEDDPR